MGNNVKDLPLSKTLMDLDNAIGVSGDEKEVAEVLQKEMQGLYDEYFTDALGNQYYVKRGKNPDKRILFAAHLDEIGFIINYIDKNGFARILPVGYHDDRMIINQDLVFISSKGKKIYGVTGSRPAHIMTDEEQKQSIPIEDLFVDFGTNSDKETRALGVEIGDYGAFARTGRFLNGTDYYSGKSIDDRSGAAVLVEVLRELKGKEIEPTICMVGSTQEEVGIRSGEPICNRFKPEQMFAVDVTITGGVPGIKYRQVSMQIGKGVCIKFFDWDKKLTCGNNVARILTNRMIEVAQKYDIPFQREVFVGGGTDAWTASKSATGILAGGVGIPMRYTHTAVGAVKISDLQHCVDFIVKYLQEYKSL
jgi:endoglucanase